MLFTSKKCTFIYNMCKNSDNSLFYITFVDSKPNQNTRLKKPMSETGKKKIAFVVNPISGTESKEQILHLLDERIDRRLYQPEVVYTERPGHAVEIAADRARQGYHAVVAIGGDGTINEVARSLVHTDTALGIIPCGSGNGLARHLRIPMEARRAIEVINGGLTDTIDYGLINERPFFCTCGVGLVALVRLKFALAGKRGPLTYIEKTLIESLKYKPETYDLEMDGNSAHYKAFVIACGNASQYGNNAYIAPQATLNDGLLDITILEPFTLLEVPTLSFQLFNKTIDQNSRVKTFRCSSLTIHRRQDGVAHFDGDPVMMGADIHVQLVRLGLKVIVPPEEPNTGVLQKAISELKQTGDSIVEDIAHTNKLILDKSKEQIKKLF